MKSVKPPSTRKGAAAFLRGWFNENSGPDTEAAILVSLPTFPQLECIDGQLPNAADNV